VKEKRLPAIKLSQATKTVGIQQEMNWRHSRVGTIDSTEEAYLIGEKMAERVNSKLKFELKL